MKKINVFFYSLFIVILSIIVANLVTRSLIGKNIYKIKFINIDDIKKIILHSNTNTTIDMSMCSNRKKINDLNKSKEKHLAKLAEYQKACNSFVTDEMMIFENMPKDSIVAKEKAKDMAYHLKEFDKFNIKPIVIVEPETDWGLVDFEEFGSGFYSNWIDDYFRNLKKEGITDKMMGTWVPFPEANLPYWNHNNATPKNFSFIVNEYLLSLKKYFPEAKTSILLNSATYENDDFSWSNGEYISLKQYVENIDKKLIDSFGIQGFPWSPPATEHGPGVFDAREYLAPSLAMEAADILKTKNVWFNTGTFFAKYTLNSNQTVIITPEKRKAILNDILKELVAVKNKGYNVKVNIFAENKSLSQEATDWSYLDNNKFSEKNRNVLVYFIKKLNQNNIHFSIFDIKK